MNAISRSDIDKPAPVDIQLAGRTNPFLSDRSQTVYSFSNIKGISPAMQKVYRMVSLVAETNSTVLLLGETGTGKGVIADAIHNSSLRKNKQMVKVNCASMPTTLIESELFGHERGSFTGAIERRAGKFELANHGTLFLDEIGEMPLDTQVKLLHALQDREITRVGGKGPVKVDVRIIAATNRNLEREVKAGRFRADLYYRLNVFPIQLPPLRERREDIATLASFFLSRYNNCMARKILAIAPAVINKLETYSWPGNVRELEHTIERSMLLSPDNELKDVQLPNNPTEEDDDRPELVSKTLQQIERAHIITTLRKCKGKISGHDGAARLLEIPSTTLHSKIKKLGISKGDYF